MLPRRNQGLECAYIARITEKNSSASCHFKAYHTGLILCLYIGDCFDITQGCNQQISSTATLYFKNKIRHPKKSAHRGREIPWDSDSVEMLIKEMNE